MKTEDALIRIRDTIDERGWTTGQITNRRGNVCLYGAALYGLSPHFIARRRAVALLDRLAMQKATQENTIHWLNRSALPSWTNHRRHIRHLVAFNDLCGAPRYTPQAGQHVMDLINEALAEYETAETPVDPRDGGGRDEPSLPTTPDQPIVPDDIEVQVHVSWPTLPHS
jgi:hypothetical protein